MKKLQSRAMLAIVGTLAACGTGGGNSNRSLDSVHQPVVTTAIYTFDVSTVGGELPPSEQGKLSGWFDAMGTAYGDRIAIEDPSLYGKGSATAQIRTMVAQRGLLLSDATPVTPGAVAAGNLRVTLTRASARVDGCPNWASTSSSSDKNATSSNYGCASNANLAAMVADPNDLIKGARSGQTDPASATKPIRVFREREPSGKGELKDNATSNDGGK